jgi:hypothetical protein
MQRVAAVILLWLVPTAIFAAAFHYDWRRVWNALGIHAMAPPFLDLRSIPAGVRTFQAGGDPLRDNPADPLRRPMNYPRVWVYVFAWLGVTDRNVWIPAFLFCALYLLGVSKLIWQGRNAWEFAVLLIAGISIAPLFAMERGNTDLLVFAIVFLGCMVEAAPFRAAAFGLAAILKIFPAAAVLAEVLRQRGRKRLWPLGMLILLAIAIAAQWKDILLIRNGTPIVSYASYGMLSLKETVWIFLVAHGWLAGSVAYVAVGAMVACYLAGAIIAWRAWRKPAGLPDATPRSKAGELFFVFGSVYAATFILGSNWDYRLIFLIPTLPFALELWRNREERGWALAYVICVLLAENCAGFEGGYRMVCGSALTVTVFLLLLPRLVQQEKGCLLIAGAVASSKADAQLPTVEYRST